jgi:transposase-like protein
MSQRRRFSAEFKARVVLELISGAKSQAQVCREHDLNPNLVCRWKAEFLQRAPELFRSQDRGEAEQARAAQLERMVGRLTLELEVAKKASALLNGHLSRSERWS